MSNLVAYHGRTIVRFAAANKGLTGACAILIFVAAFVAQVPSEGVAREIGVERTFADMLISGFNTGNSFSADWCIVPLVTQGYISYLFSQIYKDNFVLRWHRKSSVRVGKIIDALMISIVASLMLLISMALISCFRGCTVSNFSGAHSLFSYYVQMPSACEPAALSLVIVMGAYALLAVSTVNQLYLLLNKFIRKGAVSISLLFLVGCFQLYSGSSVQVILDNAPITMQEPWNPLSVIYAVGDVGYASWLVPSSHGLLPMFATLAVLVLLNALIPEKPRWD